MIDDPVDAEVLAVRAEREQADRLEAQRRIQQRETEAAEAQRAKDAVAAQRAKDFDALVAQATALADLASTLGEIDGYMVALPDSYCRLPQQLAALANAASLAGSTRMHERMRIEAERVLRDVQVDVPLHLRWQLSQGTVPKWISAEFLRSVERPPAGHETLRQIVDPLADQAQRELSESGRSN